MLAAEPWARATFGGVRLGDRRRTARVIRAALAIAADPCRSLPQIFPDWSGLKPVYRVLNQPEVTHAALIEPHREQVRAACRAPGHYVLPADITQLDFTAHRAARGMGRIGDDRGRGLLVLSTLALRLEPGALDCDEPPVRLLGLHDQQVWRRDHAPLTGNETRTQRLKRPRQSQRWGAHLAAQAPQARALQDGPAENLPAALEQAPVLGETQVPLRARPGAAARTARLELRAMAVTPRPPKRPDTQLRAVALWVVQARAIDATAPGNGARLDWTLLTTHRCATGEQTQRVLRLYGLRWLIEEYHKALKSGTRIQATQLQSADAIEALLGILGPVATRLLDVKRLGRAQPNAPAPDTLCTPAAQRVLEKSVGKPRQGWTCQAFIRAIARLGGFLGRKHDGEPGWQTIWTGWQVLQQRLLGYRLALDG